MVSPYSFVLLPILRGGLGYGDRRICQLQPAHDQLWLWQGFGGGADPLVSTEIYLAALNLLFSVKWFQPHAKLA